MSWFSAVTGKAEDFLNRLDKSAADALHTDEKTLSQKSQLGAQSSTAFIPSDTSGSQALHSSKPLSPSQSVPVNLHHFKEDVDKSSSYVGGPVNNASVKTAKAPQSSSLSSGKTVKKKDSDEALFDFLNSKDASDNGKKRRTPISSRHHSRQSSTSSVVSSSSKGPKSEPQPAAQIESAITASAPATTLGSKTQGNIFNLNFNIMS